MTYRFVGPVNKIRYSFIQHFYRTLALLYPALNAMNRRFVSLLALVMRVHIIDVTQIKERLRFQCQLLHESYSAYFTKLPNIY